MRQKQRILAPDNSTIARPETEQHHYPERTGIPPRLERYCRRSRARRALRDPAPPARWPRWGFGGAAGAATNRTEDLDGQITEKAISRVTGKACSFCELLGRDCSGLRQERRSRLEARSPHRDVAVACRRHDCRDDGRHRSAQTVEIFLKGERIAAHMRMSGNHKHTSA